MTTQTTSPEAYMECLQLAALYVARGWGAGNEAVNEDGKDVDPFSPDARYWSLEGAVCIASKGNDAIERQVLSIVRDQIILEDPELNVSYGSPMAFASDFNYDATHSDQVIGLLMRAAARQGGLTSQASAPDSEPSFICTKCGRFDDDAEPEKCGYRNCFVAQGRRSTASE